MELFEKLKDKYDNLWKAVVRPPRDKYDIKNLGPKIFKLKGEIYNRSDFQLKNRRGLTIECSHYEPAYRVDKQMPCVIYLHGNCSSRIEAIHAVEFILPLGMTLFCFDFAGCGKSEGEYVSLGWHERDDVQTVINYLQDTGTVSNIGLWGRSMGAVTALMYVQRDRSIKALVLDSAFSDLEMLFEELAKYYTDLPKLIISGVLPFFKKTIQSKADFDIEDLVPITNADLIFIPALFVTGKSDDFVDPHHTKDLYERYGGNKKLIIVEGDHNSDRPDHLLEETAQFFSGKLKPAQIKKDDTLYSYSQYNFSKTEEKYPDIYQRYY